MNEKYRWSFLTHTVHCKFGERNWKSFVNAFHAGYAFVSGVNWTSLIAEELLRVCY